MLIVILFVSIIPLFPLGLLNYNCPYIFMQYWRFPLSTVLELWLTLLMAVICTTGLYETVLPNCKILLQENCFLCGVHHDLVIEA
jgi:uncharacterized membrane protein YdjX (TVP38/TMEM64 family)